MALPESDIKVKELSSITVGCLRLSSPNRQLLGVTRDMSDRHWHSELVPHTSQVVMPTGPLGVVGFFQYPFHLSNLEFSLH